jgi:hypothetical protein
MCSQQQARQGETTDTREHHMSQQQVPQAVSEIVARYVAVWNERDSEARRAAVAALWLPEGIEFVEGAAFRGHEELFGRVSGAHQEFVASGRYTVTTAGDTSRHSDIVAFTIQLSTPSDDVAWASRVFLLLDHDGVIREDYQLTVKPLAE